MATRVPIDVNFKGRTIPTVALVNTGFETSDSEILLPGVLVRKFWAKELRKAKTDKFRGPGGSFNLKILGNCNVSIRGTGDANKPVKATIVVSSDENEIILNDVLSGALGIQLIDIAHGIWKLTTDAESTSRQSSLAELWS